MSDAEACDELQVRRRRLHFVQVVQQAPDVGRQRDQHLDPTEREQGEERRGALAQSV